MMAIARMHTGKAPGPDGYTLTYYKTFSNILTPHFLAAYNDAGEGALPPEDSLRAFISVIPKEGKDPLLCQNYRPISLLNIDLKIFTKVLSMRLSELIPSLVHLDQVGFVPSREARDNTIKAINLIHAARVRQTPLLLLSTDAEKAFDRVSWPFLIETLHQIGFGTRIMNWIHAIYSKPTARVKVNGQLSSPLGISNGTRQGCPLSPLIFILFLEPFLRTVRDNPNITGIQLSESLTPKTAAFADDLLFFITNPLISLPKLMSELRIYGTLSAFKVNFQKSEALNISMSDSMLNLLKLDFPFKWSETYIAYLGIRLLSRVEDIFPINFPPLLSDIKKDLLKWQSGGFSWFGRCSIIKMNIMPRLLYYLQTLPVKVPKAFLQATNRTIGRFIWAQKPPRLAQAILRLPKTSGGIGLPDVRLYHAACHLTRIIDWCKHEKLKQWIQIEQLLAGLELKGLPWCQKNLQANIVKHPTLGETWRITQKINKEHSIAPAPSPLTPVIGNPDFRPGCQDTSFLELKGSERSQLRHFILNGQWMPRNAIMEDPLLECLSFWQKLQLAHFIKAQTSPTPYLRALTPFEQLSLEQEPMRHSISLTYQLLIASPKGYKPPYITKWERDLGLQLSEKQVERVILFTFKTSISATQQEAGFKIMSQWYYTPARLQQMFPQSSDLCWRCGEEAGTLLHIFWSCKRLSPFWSEVHRITQKFTDRELPKSPEFFLLHHHEIPSKAYRKSILPLLSTAAKSCIPLLWKQTEPPVVALWLKKIADIYNMEDLIVTEKGNSEKFLKKWYYWREFFYSEEHARLLA